MTIRAQFQPQVDEFIDDLYQFATGSYLKDGETEFWEQPFDPKALPELKAILERLLDGLDALPDDPPGGALSKVVTVSVQELEAFNARHADAVIEPEERASIREIIQDAAAATGADDEALGELPDFEQ
ncbi:hypothetical protein C3B44_05610 [Corynebacterium yudongzhengii]|uniref:Uncharacterized protein n=1 Tax=Corynebacterium yudongzhengii TaxID=2080740 RepID=A0A2U1T8E8_9CORY|nr:hypothetical protein [Corynebacterium yudongzhengii]AWB81895.1 hypothetical protein C3B44_05610 [Corynebacterium yudongzhengii]PWC02287.1 hypothetical protein DF222_02830 [Corynebacterium yudongzhengii]